VTEVVQRRKGGIKGIGFHHQKTAEGTTDFTVEYSYFEVNGDMRWMSNLGYGCNWNRARRGNW
jgi:hypothetical protein